MDTLQFNDILDDKFGNNRPTTSDFIIVDESNHQVIIEWHNDSVTVTLNIWPHTDFQEIVPDDAMDCQYYDNPTDPSTIEELPEKYVNTFTAVVKAVKEKYDMKDEYPSEDTVCNACFQGDNMLPFRTILA